MNVIPNLTEGDFHHHFRMGRESFLRLFSFCESKSGFLCISNDTMSLTEMLYICLWYLANQSSIREISLIFNRSISSVWRAVDRITQILERNQEEFIKWPKLEHSHLVAGAFQKIAGFPWVLGSIDGTHIKFEAPKENQKDFNNRKRFHSLILIATCLPSKAFSYTFSGFPGSAHDSRVFKCSDLHKVMCENPDSLFPSSEFHIIGDSAFPCSIHLMPSIKNSLADNEEKRRFNHKLSKTRIVIEHAFGDLKNTWRRLLFVKSSLQKAVSIIASCCVLHNFLIANGERTVRYRTATEETHVDIDEFADDWFSTLEGFEKRQELVQLLSM